MLIIDNYAMAVVYDVISAPIKYIDSLEKKQHIVLLYEDAEFARLVEFRFIKIGLDLGEQCLYATREDSGSIILKFLTYGMPIEYFKSGRLRVCQILPVTGDKETMFARYKMELTKLVKDLRPPFRMVSRIVPDVSTMDGISMELELERIVHDCFADF